MANMVSVGAESIFIMVGKMPKWIKNINIKNNANPMGIYQREMVISDIQIKLKREINAELTNIFHIT